MTTVIVTSQNQNESSNQQVNKYQPMSSLETSQPFISSYEPSVITKHVTTIHGDLGLADRLANEIVYVGDCDNRTRLLHQIGGGSFGEIYLGERVDNLERVAIKVELQHPATQFLINEGNTYRKLEGIPGIPRALWYGFHGTEYTMMVMELLGSTLYEHWVQCDYKFSMKTVLMLIDQMLRIVQKVHQQYIIHRDISVSNFMLNENLDQVHLIDFGHAKRIDPANRMIPANRRRRISTARPLVGTPRFASVFSHMGQEEGYRDDLESLAYIWIYLLKGKLPWQGQKIRSGESKLDRIAFIKVNTRLESLCEGIPEEFLVYMNYVRRLKPTEFPDHDQLLDLFRNLGSAMDIKYDWKFDWITEKRHMTHCTRG